jgi:iron complex transport system substrate-binding protein
MVVGIALLSGGCAGIAASQPAGAPTTACGGPATATADVQVRPVRDEVRPTLPVDVTDARGRTVAISDASRILAVDSYGTLATTVYALGLGDRLVGRDISTEHPALASLPVVTQNGHELNAEAVLGLAPTVVLTDYSIGPLEVQLQLEDAGIPVVFLDAERRRAAIGPQIRAVAAALGVKEAGAELAATVERDVRSAEARVAELARDSDADAPRMAFLYMRGNSGVYYWFGEGSGADDLIEALGGVDVASTTGVTGERPLNAEGLVRAAPELFLMMSKGLESVGGVEGLLDVPGVAETAAGAGRCVVAMDDSQILGFGPQFPATLEALAETIYRHER